MSVRFRIDKFKLHQYQWRAISPNYMLAKVTVGLRNLTKPHFGLTNEVCHSYLGNRHTHTNDYCNPRTYTEG